MAFSDQVEALTGITISASGTNPTNDQLSQYLVDGTKDVINKMIVARPEEINKFTATTHDANDSGITVTGKIVSVVREHDSTSILRQCTPISAGLRYEATDTDSLNYRSAYNPGYYTLNGKIHTVPVSASGNNDSIVTQVTYAINQGHSSSSIDAFPDEYEYLVVLYAAVKSINTAMANIITGLSAFSASTVIVDTIVPPEFTYANASDDTSIDSAIVDIPDLEDLGSKPAYTPPTIGGTADEVTDVTALDSENTIDDFDGNVIEYDQWFATASHYIEGLEDSELAGLQLNKISTYIQAYQAAMQNQLNEFNEANVKYQAEIQEHMQEAQNEVTRLTTIYSKNTDVNIQNAVNSYREDVDEYSANLQKYQAEVQAYSAEVNTEVQEQATKVQTESARYQWLQDRAAALQAEYIAAFGTPQPQGGGR